MFTMTELFIGACGFVLVCGLAQESYWAVRRWRWRRRARG